MASASVSYPNNLTLDEQKAYDITLLGMARIEGQKRRFDDLPEDVNNIIVEHIMTNTPEDKDEYGNQVIIISRNSSIYAPDMLITNIILTGVRGNEYEKKYDEDKMLSLDYTYWKETDEAMLTIEDKYSTVYCEYNRKINYLDEKIDLPRILECLKKKITE